MKLHKNETLFRQAIQATADQLHIPAIYVEKDYWVTYALFLVFNDNVGKDAVFKGGTALSKCYHIVNRFSEDIDLVVVKREGDSNNRLTEKIKRLGTVISKELPEIEVSGITHKMGMNRKTAHIFIKKFKGDYGHVRPDILVEATWLGYHEPHTTKSIISFVGQMMIDNKQSDMAKENGLLPFNLQVLEPIRTICEKIMSLVRFSYGESPMDDLKKKIRHTYDLHQLLRQSEYLEFFHSPAFVEMILKVANDDVASFKNNNQWLAYHPKDALIFRDLENVWKELTLTYKSEFKAMVYGILPEETAILGTLKMIRERLEAISWTIKIGAKK